VAAFEESWGGILGFAGSNGPSRQR